MIAKRIAMPAAIVAASVVALLVAAGCHNRAAAPLIVEAERPGPSEQGFVGDEVCGKCHGTEFDLHQHSRHHFTLRAADAATLGSLSPPDGRIAQSAYEIRRDGNGFRFERSDQPGTGTALQYAFGSGKWAMTYIGQIGFDRLTELRMTYRPRDHAWNVTPGQESTADLNLGHVNELGRARGCILCHAVAVKSDEDAPAVGFLGVGCESCHGPGRDHVAAMRAGGSGASTDTKMANMTSWGAARIDAVCARCHRSASDLTPGAMEWNSTARFQPYGLEMSPCFKQSHDKLSCISCHDPHSDASKDPKVYEKVCLSCHSAMGGGAVQARSCPVNQRDGCVGCHMPKQNVFGAANVPIKMADHLIWAYRRPAVAQPGAFAKPHPG